ncbi:MAG: phosphopantetheinyl transferase [Candidatus Endobugula sp.]
MSDDSVVSMWMWRDYNQLPESAFDQYQQCLSDSEQQRLQNISAARRRREYIAGHFLLRSHLNAVNPKWLSNHSVEHPQDAAPFLKGAEEDEVYFNLSHSHNVICCVVSLRAQVGVDIELPSKARSIQQIAEHYFSATEAELIASLPSEDQALEFYRLWTLKESVVKARRKQLGPEGLRVEFSPRIKDENSDWYSYSFVSDDLYCALSLSQPLVEPLTVSVYHLDMQFNTIEHPQLQCYTPIV